MGPINLSMSALYAERLSYRENFWLSMSLLAYLDKSISYVPCDVTNMNTFYYQNKIFAAFIKVGLIIFQSCHPKFSDNLGIIPSFINSNMNNFVITFAKLSPSSCLERIVVHVME